MKKKKEPPTLLGKAILKIEARMISDCCSTTGDLNFQGWTKATASSPLLTQTALHLEKEELTYALCTSYLLSCRVEPWNSKTGEPRHFFCPQIPLSRHDKRAEASARGSAWHPSALSLVLAPMLGGSSEGTLQPGRGGNERAFTSICLLVRKSPT